MNAVEKIVPEQIMEAPTSASPLGYSRSKWVAERICHNANESTRLRSRIAILRVGQLSGDTRNGIWNTQEAWPMMLSTARLTGCLPALKDEPLNWLPVDTAAKAFVQALSSMCTDGKASRQSRTRVYHVINEHQKPEWVNLLPWLKKMEEFDVVGPREWLAHLEKSKELKEGKYHPAMKLLGHWKNAYGDLSLESTKAR
ncbi:Male sterility NAD-binding protein, partial [Macrophomina phaseolina MS6]